MSARLLKRIGCFHSDVDFGVTAHLGGLGQDVALRRGAVGDLLGGPRRVRLDHGHLREGVEVSTILEVSLTTVVEVWARYVVLITL